MPGIYMQQNVIYVTIYISDKRVIHFQKDGHRTEMIGK